MDLDIDAMNPQQAADDRKDAELLRWLTRHASLGFDCAPSLGAVVRLQVIDSDYQTITALVDRAMDDVGD